MSVKKGDEVWIAKYALTSGIKKGSVVYLSNSDELVLCESEDGWSSYFYFNKEVFLTESEAIGKAEEMRVKKIASLKKQIAKLEKMTFEATESNKTD